MLKGRMFLKNDVLKFFGLFLGSTTDRMFYSLIFNKDYIYARNNYSSIRMKNFYITTNEQYSLNLDLAIDYFKIFKKDNYSAYVLNGKLIGQNIDNKIELDLQKNDEDMDHGFYDFPNNYIEYDYDEFVNKINIASSIGYPEEHFNMILDISAESIFSMSNTTFIKTPLKTLNNVENPLILNFRYEFIRHLYKLLNFVYNKKDSIKIYYNEDYCIFDLGAFIIKYIFKKDNTVNETMNTYNSLTQNIYKQFTSINSILLKELSKELFASTKKFPSGHYMVIQNGKIKFIQNMYNNKLSTKELDIVCKNNYVIHINNNQFYKFIRTIKNTNSWLYKNLTNKDFERFDIFKISFDDIDLYTF